MALGVWSAVLVCAGELGTFSKLIEGVIFIGWIFYGLGAAAIFPIRRATAGRPIPYRVPGYPWTPFIFVLVAAVIVGNAIYLAFRDPSQFMNLAAAVILFLIGLPAYFFWRKGSMLRPVSAGMILQRVFEGRMTSHGDKFSFRPDPWR
jgi:APA family basic amino acid/polyamine antiporter